MKTFDDYSTHEYFLQLINTTTKDSKHLIHNNHVWKFLVELTKFLPQEAKAAQRLWHIHNNIAEIPMCCTCLINHCRWSVKQQRYTHHCSNHCRAIDPQVEYKRKRTCVSRYGEDKSLSNPSHLQLTRDTCVQTHGTEYPLQNAAIRAHTVQTLIDHYGNDAFDVIRQRGQEALKAKHGDVSFGAMFASPEYQAKKQNTKIQKWLPDRLDSFSTVATPLFTTKEYKRNDQLLHWQCCQCNTQFDDTIINGKIPRCPVCYPLNRTFWAQTELAEFVRTIDPTIVESTRSIITPKELDIYSSKHKIGIEYNGLYWHSDARSEDAATKHLDKLNMCQEQGIRLLHIFEDDWKHKRQIVESIIRNAFGQCTTKVYARHCDIVTLTHAEASKFLNNNHIQGEDRSSIRYGLMHKDRLVYVMTFGKSRFDKSYEYELYRAASVINTTIVGGVSRLFKHFLRTYSFPSVVTYADKSLFTGNSYKSLGFTQMNDTPAAYSYVSIPDGCTTRFSRFKFQKHKLPGILPSYDPSMTEDQNMRMNGYCKVWDCGNSKWGMLQ